MKGYETIEEGRMGRTISDNQRLPTAKMVHAFYSEKLLMNRTVMGHCYQDFLR